MRYRALVLSVGVVLSNCTPKQAEPTRSDSMVRLTYHEVKTAEDLEIAARYASNFYAGPSSAGVGSLVRGVSSGEFNGPAGVTYSLRLKLPFKRFERPLVIAIAFPTKAEQHYRLWADVNFDKSFSSEEELKPKTFGKRSVFGPLRSQGNAGIPVCYVEPGMNILFIPTGWMEGEYVVDGIKNVIAAFDTDHSGEFVGGDDFFDQNDHLIVGQYKDDIKFRRYKDGWPPFDSHMRQLLDGSFCTVSVTKDGTSAILTPVKAQGTLEVSAIDAEISNHRQAPQYFKTAGRTLKMPQGEFYWSQIRAIMQDPEGARWQIEYFKGVSALLWIVAGATTRLELGPPFKVDASAEAFGDGVSYHAFLSDRYGNSIIDVIGPDGEVVVPKLVITDVRGKVVASPDWLDTTTVSFTSGDHGKKDAPLTFTITWDFGAFGKVSSVNVLK